MNSNISSSKWAGLKQFIQRTSWFVTSVFFASMTIQSSGFASYNKIEFNIIITPDNFPIVWPKDDGTGNPVDYGQGSSLSASQLLNAYVCLASANCTVEAISSGAVYYTVVNIAGVGEVIFYYDELGKLVGTQKKSELAYVAGQQENSNEWNSAPNTSTAIQQAAIGGEFPTSHNQYVVGSTKASFKVVPSGSANYTIPIFTPPAINGLQPALSIGYNSHIGNGLLGVGFKLNGISAITRCSKTQVRDDITPITRPPEYNNEDAFCLDGQRLVLVSGVNGTQTAIYRTEDESYSRIKITAANDKGPTAFTVNTKSGKTITYAENIPLGKTGLVAGGYVFNTLLWPVTQIKDASGQTIDFSYTPNEDHSTGYRPTQISYGGASSLSFIKFEYESRTDIREGYSQNYDFRTDKRLSSITVTSGINLSIRKYNLNYQSDENEKSRIDQIQECGAPSIASTNFTECLPPIKFDWSGNGLKAFASPSKKLSSFGIDDGWDVNKHSRFMSDVNGDGLRDVVGFGYDGVHVSLSTSNGFQTPVLWRASYGYDDGWDNSRKVRTMADVNGDGRSDVVGFGDKGVYVSLSTGTGFQARQLWQDKYGYDDGWLVNRHSRLMADVNGDGRSDVVGFGNSGVYVSLSTGTGFQARQFWQDKYGFNDGWDNTRKIRMMSDVNGDGLSDVVGFGNNGVYVSLSTGTGFQARELWQGKYGYDDGWRVDKHPRMMTDVNGDGLSDVVGFASGGVYVSLSTGTGFETQKRWLDKFGYSDGWFVDKHPRMMSDVNGDGYSDVVGFGDGGVYVALSTGKSFQDSSRWVDSFGVTQGWDVASHPRVVGDVNGDGITDIIGFASDGVYSSISKNYSGHAKVVGISNGPKTKTTINYGYLTQDGEDFYSKGEGVLNLSERTITLPQSVVKSISVDNGIGGFNRKSYRYKDLRYSRKGYGIRGFKEFEVTDHAKKTRTSRRFLRTFPFKGQLDQLKTESFDSINASNDLINPINVRTVYNNYQIIASPLTGKVTSIVNDLKIDVDNITGIAESTYTGFDGTTRKIDDYGNVEWAQIHTTGHGQTNIKTITNSYYPPDTTNWKIDRLQDATVTHHFDGPSSDATNTDISRSSSFTYYDNGQLHTETIEPNANDITLRKVTTYEYDQYGQPSKITSTGLNKQGAQITRTADISRTFEAYLGKPAMKQTTTNSLGESESVWTSSLHGGQVGHRGPNGKESRAEFDALGRKISETSINDVTRLTTYDWSFDEPLGSI